MLLTIENGQTSTSVREKLSAVWIGRSFYSEFQESYSSLEDHFRIRLAAVPSAVLNWARNPAFDPPVIVILAEDYPRQFTEGELSEINSLWPLTQFVQVVNDWCEGDPRSRFAQQSVIRILRDEFPLWIERAIQQHANHFASSWQQPPASAVEHHWLEQNPSRHADHIHREEKPTQKFISHIAVLSHSFEDHIALTDSLKSFGFFNDKNASPAPTSIRFLDFLKRHDHPEKSPLDQPDLIIANSHNGLERELDIYQSLRSHWPNAAWLVLINFPRSQDIELLSDWPNSRVLPKPCSLAMLETVLNEFNH